MPTDREKLLSLWNLEDIPACDEGMELAQTFLESAGRSVDDLGKSNPVSMRSALLSAYDAMVEHRATCEKCNEV
jgi:hypothetical protein